MADKAILELPLNAPWYLAADTSVIGAERDVRQCDGDCRRAGKPDNQVDRRY